MNRIGARIMTFLLMSAMLFSAAAEPAQTSLPEQEPMEPVYTFDLTVNGKHELAVQTGDIVTVVFTLTRTDEDEENSYVMYSMQNEIEYDDSFVLPMENGCITQPEIDTQDIALRGYGRAFYMNYLSLLDGSDWQDNQLVGTFQLQINAQGGVTELKNNNFCVTKPDAQEVFEVNSNDLLLYVSDECVIRFETNGGSEIENATVNYGELLARPADPIREGWHLRGWYKDYDLTEEWNFETDRVGKNCVLYAAWDEGDPDPAQPSATQEPVTTDEAATVSHVCMTFETFGGEAIEDLWVEENQTVAELPTPVREGYVFAGWYKDAQRTEAWDAESDVAADKRTKLYAAWEEE